MIRCRKCNTELTEQVRFCNVCGSSQTPAGSQVEVSTKQVMPPSTPSGDNTLPDSSQPSKWLTPTQSMQPGIKQSPSSQKSSNNLIHPKTVTRPPVIPARLTNNEVKSPAAFPQPNSSQSVLSPKPAASAPPLNSSSLAYAPEVPKLTTQLETSRSANPAVLSSSAKAESVSNTPTQSLGEPSVLARMLGLIQPIVPKSSARSVISSRARDAVTVLFPLSVLLWSISLKYVDIRQMNDLGLVSVFPASIIIALFILNVSFCLTIGQARVRVSVAFLHLALLIFMLYSVTTFVEEAVRFSTVYRHAGYTEYILRTGSVDPYLDTYFDWPGFFVLSAFVTKAAGYHDILQYAAWTPVFLNLIYFGPLYIIFTTATSNRRLVWLALWFFYLTNWVAQDYFSPQGLNYFFYLTIIAVLLKWFKVPATTRPPIWTRSLRLLGHFTPFTQKLYEWVIAPDQIQEAPIQLWQRRALLVFLVVIFAFDVFSHPLTPFFVLASVMALTFLGRCKPFWLPLLMGLMTVAWIVFMTQPFLAGHSSMVGGNVGQVQSSITTNVNSRVSEGDPQHMFVAEMRVVATIVIWGLAFLGMMRCILKGHSNLTYLLLAIVPFPLIAVQDYGGEMFLRIYLFVLPIMVFFTATLFYTPHRKAVRGTSVWVTGACIATCILLMAGFLITRYGNENVDYKTYAEVNGVDYLYHVAPPHSVLLQGWEDTPWMFQDYEKYTYDSLNTAVPGSVVTENVDAIIQFSQSQKNSTYIIFTRSQIVSSESFSGLPSGTLNYLESRLVNSGKFKLIYSNPDVKILIFVGAAKEAKV